MSLGALSAIFLVLRDPTEPGRSLATLEAEEDDQVHRWLITVLWPLRSACRHLVLAALRESVEKT